MSGFFGSLGKMGKYVWKTQGKTFEERAIKTGNDIKSLYDLANKEAIVAKKGDYKPVVKIKPTTIMKQYAKDRKAFLKSSDLSATLTRIPPIDDDDLPGALEAIKTVISGDMKTIKKLQKASKKQDASKE